METVLAEYSFATRVRTINPSSFIFVEQIHDLYAAIRYFMSLNLYLDDTEDCHFNLTLHVFGD